MSLPCPSDDHLLAFARSQRVAIQSDEVQSHLSECDRCARRLDELQVPGDDFGAQSNGANLNPEKAARALRMQAGAANDSRAGGKLLHKAYRQARRGVWWGRLFPSGNAEALREMSLTLQQMGKTKRALKYATKSCRVAQHQDAKYEYAQSDLVRAKLMHELEMPDADKHIETAEAELERFEVQIRTS